MKYTISQKFSTWVIPAIVICGSFAELNKAFAIESETLADVVSESPFAKVPTKTIFDTWIPYTYGKTPFTTQDSLVISENAVALPGCEPVKVAFVPEFPKFLKFIPGYSSSEFILMRLEALPHCGVFQASCRLKVNFYAASFSS